MAIVNAHAGGEVENKARAEIERAIVEVFPGARIVFIDAHTDVTETARTGVAEGARLVIAGGGDGTINAVATAVQGSDAVLGILPIGTLNHFAKDLAIPTDIAAAIAVIAAGHETRVDVGDVNGSVFLNNSGLGLYPGIVALRERRQRGGMSKWPALAWATVKVLARYSLMTIHLDVAGQQLVRTTPVVFVGNNDYLIEGLRVGKRERLDAGTLSLFVPNHRGPFSLLWFSFLAVLGFKDRHGTLDHLLAREIRIESGPRHLAVSIDGEVVRMRAPLTYRIKPRALRVMVPTA